MKRTSGPPEEGGDSPLSGASWLYSYADLMTQLLLFAIMMVIIAGLDPPKTGAVAPKKDPLAEAEKALDQFLAQSDLKGQVAVERGADRLVIRVTSKLLFDEAQASLGPRAEPVLAGVVRLLAPMPHKVRVEGHTDNVPIHTAAFPSNWELSSARAISVEKYLEEHGIARARLSVAGYAEHHPMMPNDSAASRALNRRVELVVLEE